jgi:hypothetical protein
MALYKAKDANLRSVLAEKEQLDQTRAAAAAGSDGASTDAMHEVARLRAELAAVHAQLVEKDALLRKLPDWQGPLAGARPAEPHPSVETELPAGAKRLMTGFDADAKRKEGFFYDDFSDENERLAARVKELEKELAQRDALVASLKMGGELGESRMAALLASTTTAGAGLTHTQAGGSELGESTDVAARLAAAQARGLQLEEEAQKVCPHSLSPVPGLPHRPTACSRTCSAVRLAFCCEI